jgi:hypothetical protein
MQTLRPDQFIKEKGDEQLTPTFFSHPVKDEEASKKAGRPIYKDVDHVKIRIAGNKYTVGVFPAVATWMTKKQMTEYGEEEVIVTYADRFNKQYLEYKAGDQQSFGGTPLAEAPFLSEGKRRELKAIHVNTVEALAAIDGQPLKMLGPGGRELKNQAIAYIENALKGVGSTKLADELSKRDKQIEDLMRQMAEMKGEPSEKPASAQTVSTFETFTDEDIQAWLEDAKVTVDKRWGRNTLISKAEEVLAKEGKKKAA